MPKFDHFNIIAFLYDKTFGRNDQTEIIEDLMPLPDGASLLDAAGGTGRVSIKLAHSERKIFIADTAFNMLRKAKEKKLSNLMLSNLTNIPAQNASFDGILMVDALHHVVHQNAVLNEFWRVLKPGGTILIQEPNITHFSVKLLNIGEKLLGMHSYFLSPDKIATHFKDFSSKTKIIKQNKTAWIKITKND